MKIIKMSFAVMVAAGLSSNLLAADNLASAFKDGKFKGNLKAYYFNKNKYEKSDDIVALGAEVGYVTAPLFGFSAGIDLQSSTNVGTGADANDPDRAIFNGTMEASGAQLSEAYLQYNYNNTLFAKVGRQFVDTPLASGSGSRLIKESMEAYLAGITAKKSLLMGGYITKFQTRTDGDGDVGNFESDNNLLNNDNAWMVLLSTSLIPYINLTAQYLNVGEAGLARGADDDAQIFYSEATYNNKFEPFNFCLALQYVASKEGDYAFGNGAFLDTKSNTFGVQAKFDNIMDSGLRFLAAFNTTDSDSKTIHGLGNGADWGYVGHMTIMNNTYEAGSDGFMAELGYDFGKIGVDGLGLTLAYAWWNGIDDYKTVVEEDIDADEFYAKLAYKFKGDLKGLGTSVEYSDEGRDRDQQQLRVKIKYNFSE